MSRQRYKMVNTLHRALDSESGMICPETVTCPRLPHDSCDPEQDEAGTENRAMK